MAGATERLAHVKQLLPEICTLDCGSMNFVAGGDYVMVNTPDTLRAMAKQVQALGVKPELEVFDTGHLVMVKDMLARGLARRPGADPAVHGHPVRRAGRPADALVSWCNALPPGAVFSAFSIGRMQLPFAAMAALAGGNVRVGLEDNSYLGRGRAGDERTAGRARRNDFDRNGGAGAWAAAGTRKTEADAAGLRHVENIRRVGLLGGGVIGGGWAARAVLNGMDAVICDTDPEAERKVSEVIDNARRAYSMLTIAPLPKPGDLAHRRTLEEAADGADFIQESLPEREDLKIRPAGASGNRDAERTS